MSKKGGAGRPVCVVQTAVPVHRGKGYGEGSEPQLEASLVFFFFKPGLLRPFVLSEHIHLPRLSQKAHGPPH